MKKRQNTLIRDQDTGSLLELLMVTAVAAILISRGFLAAAGYPKIAPGGLHIAHMLWGGFLMLAALVMVFRYWNPSVRRFAAFTGGAGFGLFIDELGKFITQDNDYFYRPAVAMIYVIFVLLFLLFRSFAEGSRLSSEEAEVNRSLRMHLGDMHDTSSRVLKMYEKLRTRFRDAYGRIMALKGFVTVLMTVFIVLNLLQLGALVGISVPGWVPLGSTSGFSLAGGIASGAMVLVGLLFLRRSQKKAFQWFRRAVLVNVFITQIFLFYSSQLAALSGLGLNLLFYAGIDYAIRKNLTSGDDGP